MARLAYMYRVRARYDLAIESLERLRDAQSDNGQAHLAIGDIQLRLGKLDEAEDAYARASVLPELEAEGFAGRAEVAYARGNLRHAVELYDKAIEAKPGDAVFKKAREEIQREVEFRKSNQEYHDALQADASTSTPPSS